MSDTVLGLRIKDKTLYISPMPGHEGIALVLTEDGGKTGTVLAWFLSRNHAQIAQSFIDEIGRQGALRLRNEEERDRLAFIGTQEEQAYPRGEEQ